MSSWGYGAVTNGSANVGTASAAVLAANGARVYARIQNLSTAQISLGFGTAAVAGEGIRLAAAGTYGDHYEMARGYGNVFTGAINGITTVDDQAVAVIEGQ